MTAAHSGRVSGEEATLGTLRFGDFTVSRLGFGAMRITGRGIWGPPPDRAAAIRLLRRVVELGITLIDTADSYGPGVSEELIAEALAPYPDGLVIATKGGLTRPRSGEWRRDGRPDHLRAACESSLKRLRTDRVELYQLHSPDPRVPLEDSIGALVQLQREGKVRHIGISNVEVSELDAARRVANIVSVQNRYNLTDRSSEPCYRSASATGLPSSRGPRCRPGATRRALAAPLRRSRRAIARRQPRWRSRGCWRDHP